MKHLVLTALLVSVTALAVTGTASTSSDALQGTTNVVRDFVRNDAAGAWAHSYSWQWSDGILSHYPSIDTGTAQQVAMPAFDPRKLYRINIKFSNYLRGSVSVSLGSHTFKGYGDNGAYTFRVAVTDPSARLTLTPTLDYEGSIASVRVVELGDELAATAIPDWSPDGKFAPSEGNDLTLERLGVVSGHTYQVTFGVAEATGTVPGAKVGLGRGERLFSNNGHYSVDVVADQNGRLVFSPRELDAVYDGAIGKVSVREITSDPVPATASNK
jgi:hypothetical protein